MVNPVFNEAISFDIPNESLDSTGILMTVIHENKIIGCVLVGGSADGNELEHWKRMKISDKPVAEWHVLQDGRKFYWLLVVFFMTKMSSPEGRVLFLISKFES